MIRRFCDRCQKEIIEQTGIKAALGAVVDTIKETIEYIQGTPSYAIYDTNGECQVELCPACKKSFEEWIEAGSESQHTDPKNTEPEAVKFGDF